MRKNTLWMLFLGSLFSVYLLGFFDIVFSQMFFKDGKFLLQNNDVVLVVEWLLPWLLVLIALICFALWVYGKICGKPKISTEKMAFVCLSMVLAPGLIVNLIFKTFWGRARPVDLQIFGGDKEFSMPFEIADQCNLDCSFMSGHTSVAFWMLVLVLASNVKKKQNLFVVVFFIAALVALMRVAQGKHFLSDVVAAATITLMVVYWCYQKLLIKEQSKEDQDFRQK